MASCPNAALNGFAKSFVYTDKGTNTAFIDLKSTFGTTNREIIFEK